MELGSKQKELVHFLETTKITQAKRAHIKSNNSWCILGLLYHHYLGWDGNHEREIDELVIKLRELFGITTTASSFETGTGKMVQLNDMGYSFHSIAQMMKEHPEDFFSHSV